MTANAEPIYTKVGDLQSTGAGTYMTAANTTADLTSGTSYLVFTADATNGGFVSRVRFFPTPAGNTTATVARLWINNGATTGTGSNNWLWDNITLPLITASAVAAIPTYDVGFNFAFSPGYRIYVTLGTASANGWIASVVAGKY